MTSKTVVPSAETIRKAESIVLDARAYVDRYPGTANLSEFEKFAAKIAPKASRETLRLAAALAGTYSRYQGAKRDPLVLEAILRPTPAKRAPKVAPKVETPASDAPASE